MQRELELQYSCHFLQFGEPQGDFEGELWSAWHEGELLVADSFKLMLELLQERTHRPLYLMAA